MYNIALCAKIYRRVKNRRMFLAFDGRVHYYAVFLLVTRSAIKFMSISRQATLSATRH